MRDESRRVTREIKGTAWRGKIDMTNTIDTAMGCMCGHVIWKDDWRCRELQRPSIAKNVASINNQFTHTAIRR